MLGIYLKEPHGRLIAEGEKTTIAHAVGNLDIVGERVLCTKEDGQGKALGIITVGQPVRLSADEFDGHVSGHHVSRKERLQWWPLREELYEYPVESFEPFEAVKSVAVDGSPIDMGEIKVQQSDLSKSASGEGDEDMPWKVFKEGKKHCVYKIDEEGNKIKKVKGGCHPTAEEAQAHKRALYAAEGRGEIKKEIGDDVAIATDEKTVSDEVGNKFYGVPYGVTSFAELTAFETAYEEAELMQKRAYQLQGMVTNICRDPDIENKAAAFSQLASEFAKIVKQPARKEYDEKEFFCPECGADFPSQEDVKAAEDLECPTCGEALKAKWDRATINNLPDSAFLHVEPGGEKDDEGKTVPRTKRHFPYKNAQGNVDLPHLRNAISRLGQAKTGSGWLSEDLRKRLLSKARGILAKHNKSISVEVKSDSLAQKLVDALVDTLNGLIGRKAPRDRLPEFDLAAIHDRLAQSGTKSAAFPCKGLDGKTYWMQWTTNAFRDREGEIFTTKSIDEFVDRREKESASEGRQLGEFWYWHLPGTKFADVTWQDRVGRFLVQLGPFDDTEVGNAFKNFFTQYPDGHEEFAPTGWGASHGYKFNSEDRDDGVYDWFDIKESTVLPEDVAANQYNPAPGVLTEDKEMNDRRRKSVDAILGEGTADALEAMGQAKTKALEEAGIAFKGNEAPAETPAEETPAEAPVEEAPVEAPVEPQTPAEAPQEATVEDAPAEEAPEVVPAEPEQQPGKEYRDMKEAIVAVAEAVKGLRDEVQALAADVQDVKRSDEEKVMERITGLPGASVKSLVEAALDGKSAIGDPNTHVDGRDALVRGKAKLPPKLAERQQEDTLSPVPLEWLTGG